MEKGGSTEPGVRVTSRSGDRRGRGRRANATEEDELPLDMETLHEAGGREGEPGPGVSPPRAPRWPACASPRPEGKRTWEA